jgi:hypothetical protein
MEFDVENALPSVFAAILPILVSLIDDILLLGLARLGWNWPWLHWVSIALIIGTVVYWVVHFGRNKSVQRFLSRKVLELKNLYSGDRNTSEEN